MRPARPNDFSAPRELRRPRRQSHFPLGFITDHVFSFFFHRRCRHFVDCGSFLITPWLMMWKKRRKKNEKMCLHTSSLSSLGLGTIAFEAFGRHVLTFLNPLSAVLGQWMETIDREICAVFELKRVSDRRGLISAMSTARCTLRSPEAAKARAANENFWSDWAFNSVWNSTELVHKAILFLNYPPKRGNFFVVAENFFFFAI